MPITSLVLGGTTFFTVCYFDYIILFYVNQPLFKRFLFYYMRKEANLSVRLFFGI